MFQNGLGLIPTMDTLFVAQLNAANLSLNVSSG